MNYKEMKKSLIHPWERPMRVINVVIFVGAVLFSITFIASSLATVESFDKLDTEEIAGYFGVFTIVAAILFQMGKEYGKSLSTSLQLSEKQFPDIYEIVKEYAEKMEMGYVPKVFLRQQGGVLNAFATSFLSRRYIMINSDIFDIAYLEHKDMDAVAFIIAHELTHLKRKHATTVMVILESLGNMIPVWGATVSRAKEYTCDRHAAWLCPQGKKSIILLVVGKHLYKDVDMEEYLKMSGEYRGFFFWLHNLLSSHPTAPKRIKALYDNTNRGKLF